MQNPTFSEFVNKDREDKDQMRPQMSAADVSMVNRQPVNKHDIMPSGGGMQVMDNRQQDPFAMQKYNGVAFPDTPISYGGGITESLLNDNEVPDNIRQKFWFVFHKDNTLTFLDEERKRSKLLNFDIAKIDILNTMPYYDYTFEEELGFTVLRNVFETKLDRALGFKGTAQKNERIVLQSQFSENRQINDNEGSNIKEGFFRRLLSRRG